MTQDTMLNNKGCQTAKGDNGSRAAMSVYQGESSMKCNEKRKIIGAREHRVLEPNRLVEGCARVATRLTQKKPLQLGDRNKSVGEPEK